MIRVIDFFLAFFGLLVCFPVLCVLALIGFFDTGSPLFIQTRVGKQQRPFKLIKFRTMSVGTAHVATHLANTNDITKYGQFLRKTKLDELPQLINVLRGEMSLVGPRPGLVNQTALTEERKKRLIYSVRPGITGFAQVNEVDMSTPKKLSHYDKLLINNLSVCWYFVLIVQTVTGSGQGDCVKSGDN